MYISPFTEGIEKSSRFASIPECYVRHTCNKNSCIVFYFSKNFILVQFKFKFVFDGMVAQSVLILWSVQSVWAGPANWHKN